MRNNLKKIRKELNISQQELADITGVSRVTISLIENQKDSPVKSDTIVALVRGLNVPAHDIFPDFK